MSLLTLKNNNAEYEIIGKALLSPAEGPKGNNAVISAKLHNTIRVLIVCAVVGTMLFISPDNVFSATSKKTYYVTVEYIDCYDNNGNPTGQQSRTETWRNNSSGTPLYQEHRSCSGETSTSGKKPLVGSDGADIIESASTRATLLDIPLATSLAMDYPPIIDTVDEYDALYYEFEFPLDWVYLSIANTYIKQTSHSVTISTDIFVQAKLVDLSTGIELTGFYNVAVGTGYTFDVTDLPEGCIYSIIIKQYIPEEDDDFIIRSHNFCKSIQ
ncbi:MAG: hypothetical protein FWG85_00065 [Bacteroidetes bacterium]|nr:hypothetical protein [Bacteroidota bacterium]